MFKLFKSSTFWFLAIVLIIGLVAVGLNLLAFGAWFEKAIGAAMIYATKEIGVYASSAYKERGNE